MKKNDIFTFTTPNGVEVTAAVLDKRITENSIVFTKYLYLCYAQNRLFYYVEKYYPDIDKTEKEMDKIIVDYAVFPDYDEALNNYKPE